MINFLVFLCWLVIVNSLSYKENMKHLMRQTIASKTIMNKPSGYGSLSTLSRKPKVFHYPQSTIVGFSVDNKGKPFFLLSSLSMHTRNLLLNNSASLCVTEYGFLNGGDARVTLTGQINEVRNKDKIEYFKEKYLEEHPYAEWINLPDFTVYHMGEIKDINYVGGFKNAGPINIGKYYSENPDPLIFNIEENIDYLMTSHFNEIKKALLNCYNDINPKSISIKNLDSEGINIRCKDGKINYLKRVSFKNKVSNFEEIKEKIDKDLF